MSEQPGVWNEISGTVFGAAIQARDITVSLPAVLPVATSGLPAQPVFVGRDIELTRLASALDPFAADTDGPPVVLAVAGLAGVGKTSLAIRAAHNATVAGWFPGGVLMVDLRGYDNPERRVQPAAALASLLGALGMPSEHIPPDQTDRERLWRSLLADHHATGQRMLIVLDNASSAEQVRPLLPGAGEHRALVTSRHTLADLGARLFDVDVLSTEHAVELLRRELAAADPDDNRINAEPTAVHQLAQLCGGLPLAIRIAAALLAADPDQPIAEMAEALANEQHRLEELDYDGSLNVRAAFDLSYRHLDRGSAQLFRLLALNPGPEISTDAAAALVSFGTAETRRLIGRLRRAHLMQPGASRGRWRMHDLLRLYAAEQAERDDDREAALDRLLSHYLVVSKAATSYLDARVATDRDHRFTGRQNALDWLDIERINLTAALTLAFDTGRYSHAVAMADAMYEFFALRLHIPEWIATHQMAMNASLRLEDRHGEARSRIHLGVAFWRLKDHGYATHHYKRALEIYRDLGDRLGEANALLKLGCIYRNLRQCKDELDSHRQALEIYRELGDRHGEAAALNGIGVHLANTREDRLEDAGNYYHQSLQIYQEVGDRSAEAGELGNLGILYSKLGLWEQALNCHRNALNIWQEFDDWHGQAGQMNNLGCTYREMGQPTQAADCWRQAVKLYRACRDHYAEAAVLYYLGQIHRQLGELDQTIIYYVQSLQIRRQLSTAEGEAETLADLGDTSHEAGQLDTAVAYWVEALDMFTALDNTHPRISQLKAALADAVPNS